EFHKPAEGAPAETGAAPAEGAPATEAREGQRPDQRQDQRGDRRGNRPPRERFDGKSRDGEKGDRPQKFGGDRNKDRDRNRNKDRDRGPRDKGGRDGGRDKRDSGPSHRQWATSAAPRERDRPADPNSPFAKLAALKEQLTAGRKDYPEEICPWCYLERQRLDKWLWHARVVKARSSAAALVEAGHVRINGIRERAPGHAVKPGDVLTIGLDRTVRVLKVIGFSERRGDAAAARLLYDELAGGPEA